MDGRTLPLLAGQAGFGILAFEILRRRVYPPLAARPVETPSVISGVWGPLALVGPALFLVGRVTGPSVGGVAWAGLGGPALIGLTAVAAALCAPAAAVDLAPRAGRLGLAAAAAGLLLLLLGGAHDLTIWTGQCTFAVAAVLLWMNTPVHGRRPLPDVPAMGHAAGAGESWVIVAAAAAAGQGFCTLFLPERAVGIGVGIAVGFGMAAAVAAVRVAGPAWGLRVGGWSAVLGTLLAVGTLSIRHLAPQTLAVITGRQANVSPLVVHGFGRYALEATILLVAPGLILAGCHAASPVRRALGAGLGLAAVALAVWRIAAI